MATLRTKLLIRNDALTEWTKLNPQLGKGELSVAWDGKTPRFKVGDGESTWDKLPFLEGNVSLTIKGKGNTIIDAEYVVDDKGEGTLTLTKGDRVASVTAGGTGAITAGATTDVNQNIVVTVSHNTLHTKDIKFDAGKDITVKPKSKPEETVNTFELPVIEANVYGHVTKLDKRTVTVLYPNTSVEKGIDAGHPQTDDVFVANALRLDTENNHHIFYDGVKVPTKKYVDEQIRIITNGAVVLRGTVGKGGTIEALPAPSKEVAGDAYKVISDYTYGKQVSQLGDMFICYEKKVGEEVSYEWMYIPSGDDIEDTWRELKVNGTVWKTSGISSGSANFKNGNLITISNDSTGLSFSHNTGGAGQGAHSETGKFVNSITLDAYGHVSAVSFEEARKDYRGVAFKDAQNKVVTVLDTATAGTVTFIPGTNIKFEAGTNDGELKITSIPYGLVTSTKNGLAPAATTANSFLIRKGSSTSVEWGSFLVIDGGSAKTKDWGTIA